MGAAERGPTRVSERSVKKRTAITRTDVDEMREVRPRRVCARTDTRTPHTQTCVAEHEWRM